MTLLVPVRRVIEHKVKVRAKADGSGVDLANVRASMDPFGAMVPSEVGVAHDTDTFDGPVYAGKVIGKNTSSGVTPFMIKRAAGYDALPELIENQ